MRVNWTDEIPPWLPPIRPPHHGRVLIVIGLVLLSAFLVLAIVLGALGGRHTFLTLLPGWAGVAFLIAGLLRRSKD